MAEKPQVCAELPTGLWQALCFAKAQHVSTCDHSPSLACQQNAGDP